MTRTALTSEPPATPVAEPTVVSTGAHLDAPVARTIVDLFLDDVRDRGDSPALRWRTDEGWQALTRTDYGEAVWDLATAFVSLGVQAGDRVAIASANRPEWNLVDMAVIAAGAVSVPLYPTSTSSQMSYVLGHSGAKVCVVDTPAQLAKVLLRRPDLEALEHVVVMDDVAGLDGGVVSRLADQRRAGTEIRERDGSRHVDERLHGIDAGDRLTHFALDQSLGRALRHRIGLDRARVLVTTAAPIGADLLRWLHAVGMPVAGAP